jgi:uncharacterized protein with GYD domain
VRNAKESVRQVCQAREAFQKQDVIIEQISWTLGSHDLVAVVSPPDGETSAAALLQLAESGNLRTTTLRAFDEAESGRSSPSSAETRGPARLRQFRTTGQAHRRRPRGCAERAYDGNKTTCVRTRRRRAGERAGRHIIEDPAISAQYLGEYVYCRDLTSTSRATSTARSVCMEA